jgi:ATP-dependent Lhr-like helicase
MFAVRWRWNAGRALAVLRFMGGKKVPPQLQRIQAEDLVSVVFPDQLACFENIQGERELPDHPLVKETIRDCLTEAMDIDHLEQLLNDIESNKLTLIGRDLREPSPLAQEILNAKPYAFLDDAPLEERRTQAVQSRRWLDPKTASELGALDADAIARVRGEAWPDAASADELHDALMLLGYLTEAEVGADGEPDPARDGNGEAGNPPWKEYFEELARDRRATRFRPLNTDISLWVAAERLPQLSAVFPEAELSPPITAPDPEPVTRDAALVELVRSRLEGSGPVTVESLAATLGLGASDLEVPFLFLENEGFAIRGQFTPGFVGTEWCDRRLLARIHRYTLNRLRREIEPVTAQHFIRFLLSWQGVTGERRGEGTGTLTRVVEQLEGFEASAISWESDLLPLRITDYDPNWLDSLCLSGRVAWARLSLPRNRGGRSAGPIRTTPVALVNRQRLSTWLALAEGIPTPVADLSSRARKVQEYLDTRGASFFSEITGGTELLPSEAEEALGELAASGWVTADGFTGLRALLIPSDRRRPRGNGRRRHAPPYSIEGAGRWSLLPQSAEAETRIPVEDIEGTARILLRRYGVVFRRLLEREDSLPAWRDLLRAYHRLEARGEIRGGRFVAGFSGEQFALPEAVGMLRDLRKEKGAGDLVSVGGSDPLNLVGIVTPGQRVPGVPGNRVLFRDGEPVAVRVAGEVQVLSRMTGNEEWSVKKALARKPYPERLRSYLGVLS